jgi:transcription elongation factor GreA
MAELPVVKRLRKEMETLRRELNVELPKELERARAHGDLSENAEWAMAKQRQELSMINIESIPRDTVGLGSKVELEDLDDGNRAEYEIVVPEEVDGAQNRISLSSPLGRALIGKACDDDIEVQTPKGKREYMVRKLVTIHTLIAAENGGTR